MELATVIYLKKGTSYKDATQYPMGAVKGGFAEHYMRNNRPAQPLILFPATTDTLRAALENKIVLFASDQPTAIYYLRKYGIFKEFSSVETLYTNTLRAAVGEGDKELLTTLITGWNNIDEARKKSIFTKWFVPSDTKPDWFLPGSLALVAVICVALIFRKIGMKRHGID